MRSRILTLLITLILISSCLLLRTSRTNLKHKRSSFPSEDYALMSQHQHEGEGIDEYKKAVMEELKRWKKTRGNSTPWDMEGPFNTGGRINCIALPPGSANTYWIGCADGGIFKTTDAGITWAPLFDQAYALSVSCIQFEPNNSQVVYVGTGDQVLGGYSHLGNGIYKSTNGGTNWTPIGLQHHGAITKLLIDPNNTNILYAGTTGNPFIADTNRGVYKSVDGGQTWNRILFLGPNAGIGDLIISPTNPTRIYCTGRRRIRSNTASVVSGPEARIYRSVNAGVSWDTLQVGLPAGPQCRIGLAMSATDPNKIYANYIDTTLDYSGLYRTTNGGDTWTTMNTNLSAINTGGFGWYFGEIRVDPNNDNKIFLLGVDLSVSTNGGSTFSAVGFSTHSDKHDLVFVNSTNVLLATDGGFYKSTNGGTSYTSYNNFPITQFYRVAFNPLNQDYYYGGAQDNGTNLGSNAMGAGNWQKIYGADGFQPAFDTTDPAIYYAEWQNGNIMATSDDGFNWDNITMSITATDRCSWNMPYFVSKFDNNTLYTGSYKVYKNTFGPFDQWIPISSDLTDGTNDAFHVITTLHQSPLNANCLYVGTSDSRVWNTLNDGNTWTLINNGLPQRNVSCVKASPNNSNAVFVSLSGYRFNDTLPHIYYSNNLGNTWTSIAGNLPNFPINDIWVHAQHQDSCLIIASDGGVYATENMGNTWVRVGNNMPIIPVYDMEYDRFKNRLFVGTFARSMQSMSLDSIFTPIQNNVSTSNTIFEHKMQLVPNPTTGYAHLLSDGQNEQMMVCNAFGQVMMQLEIKHKDQVLDLSHLLPGTYFLFSSKSTQPPIPFSKK